MLRGGETLEIGWIVMGIIVLMIIAFRWFSRDDDERNPGDGPYKDGKLSRSNGVMLVLVLIFIAVMVILAALYTPM